MGIVLANNAHTTLAANINSTDTTIYVDDVDSFPSLGVDEYFYCTIESTTGTYEIVKVTQTNSTSFLVERGQEGTIAVPFNIGARVELRVTVQSLEDKFDDAVEAHISDDAYGAGWNGSTDAPTQNAVYDKINSLGQDDIAGLFTTSEPVFAGLGLTKATGDIDLDFKRGSSSTRWTIRNKETSDNLVIFNQSVGDLIDIAYSDGAIGITATFAQPTINGSAILVASDIGSTVQAYDADLATWATLSPSANFQTLVPQTFAQMRASLDLEAGTDFYSISAADATFQPLSSNLTILAGETITDNSSGSIYLGKATGATTHYWGIKIDNTPPAIGGFKWNLENVDQWALSMNYGGTLFLYNNILSSSVYSINPSTNVMAFAVTPTVQDDAYAAGWNGNNEVPTKNAVYDKIESLSFGSGDLLAANNLSELTATASTARANLGLTIGTHVQAYDADLTSWAGVTRATGFDTFAATPSSANLRSLVTDETGTGSLVFATSPTLVTPNLGVASATSLNGPAEVSSETTGSLTSTSRNKIVKCSGNVTLPSSGMTDGDCILIDPRGTARTITRPGSHTMYVNDTDSATATTKAHNPTMAMYHGSSKWTLQGVA